MPAARGTCVDRNVLFKTHFTGRSDKMDELSGSVGSFAAAAAEGFDGVDGIVVNGSAYNMSHDEAERTVMNSSSRHILFMFVSWTKKMSRRV